MRIENPKKIANPKKNHPTRLQLPTESPNFEVTKKPQHNETYPGY